LSQFIERAEQPTCPDDSKCLQCTQLIFHVTCERQNEIMIKNDSEQNVKTFS